MCDAIKEWIHSSTETLNYADFQYITGELSIYSYDVLEKHNIKFLLQRFPVLDEQSLPDIIPELIKLLNDKKSFI